MPPSLDITLRILAATVLTAAVVLGAGLSVGYGLECCVRVGRLLRGRR